MRAKYGLLGQQALPRGRDGDERAVRARNVEDAPCSSQERGQWVTCLLRNGSMRRRVMLTSLEMLSPYSDNTRTATPVLRDIP